MSPALYPANVFENPPEEFDDEIIALCDKVEEAVKGWGTDEDSLVRELGDEPADKRVLLYHCYKATKGKDLRDVMKSELGSGDLGMAMQLLVLPLDMAEALIIKNAGSKVHLIYPIICGRTNDEINKLKSTYFTMFDEDLGVHLADIMGGDFERLIFFALQGMEKEMDEEYFTPEKAEADADAFYEAGQGRFGTDESSIFKIIIESPTEHLENVNKIYQAKHDFTLTRALGRELGGNVAKAAKYATGMKLWPALTAAVHVKETCAGFGTDEMALTCAILRYQAIMVDVENAHVEDSGSTIIDRIESEVGGKYKRLLKKMVEFSL